MCIIVLVQLCCFYLHINLLEILIFRHIIHKKLPEIGVWNITVAMEMSG